MALGLVDALSRPHPCPCDCFEALTVEERAQGIAALFRFDDAMRGWGYDPLYDPQAHNLFRAAQRANDASYRGVAVRDHACVTSRLLGFAVHEVLHALHGDTTQANYGIPFGMPYGVPESLPVGEERAYIEPFNRGEARAWVGVVPFAEAAFGIRWRLRTARDVGTYGFVGGNAIVDVPPGFRAVPHVDRVHHPERYYALARRLEEEERAAFTPAFVDELVARFAEAERLGAAKRKRPWPDPMALARIAPKWPGRNDPCICGSGKKWKACCEANLSGAAPLRAI